MRTEIGTTEAIHKLGEYRQAMRTAEKQRGFTLVELVVVIVMIGILAVYVAPRFFDASIFKSRGFADQVQAALRYAQKQAIAQHRNVCVAVTSSDIILTIAKDSGATNSCNQPNLVPPFTQPSTCTSSTYRICTPSSSITLTLAPASPATFVFDALGKPWDAAGTTASAKKTISISGVTNPIYVEPETGYVHSP